MFKKILVPLDGSELAASILPQVAELARKFQSELILIHVSPGLEQEGEPPPGTTAAAVLQTCQAYLGMLGKELNRDLKVEVACVRGNVAREILKYAADHQVDLIAMATHGSGEVAWLLGSIARKVITHASRPVMVFRVLEVETPPLKKTART
jgi:nucleotide-binding universal stress UspA family protein|uniref:Universal stress protein n=1 Tax=Desulfobacca acetoxidans TaxID=60893 RepID=A0A7C3UZ68_9BACT